MSKQKRSIPKIITPRQDIAATTKNLLHTRMNECDYNNAKNEIWIGIEDMSPQKKKTDKSSNSNESKTKHSQK